MELQENMDKKSAAAPWIQSTGRQQSHPIKDGLFFLLLVLNDFQQFNLEDEG